MISTNYVTITDEYLFLLRLITTNRYAVTYKENKKTETKKRKHSTATKKTKKIRENLLTRFFLKRKNEQEEEKRFFFLLHCDIVNNINVFNLFEVYDFVLTHSLFKNT